MSKTRDKKRARKREDLEMLTALLGLADRFGPRQQTQDQLLQEQLMSAMQQRMDFQQMSPFRSREAEARIGSVEDQRRYGAQEQPLRMAELGSQTKARDIDSEFAQRTLQDRLKLPGLEAQQRKLQNDQMAAVLPYQGQGASLDNALKQQAADMGPLQRTHQGLQNRALQQNMQQEEQLQPFRMQSSAINQASNLQQIGMMNQQPFDAKAYLQQQGVAYPMAPNPNDPAVQADKMLQSGMVNLGTPGGQQWLGENAGAFQGTSLMPTQLGPQAQGLMEMQQHPQAYGMPEFMPNQVTPEMIQQAMRAVQQRLQLNR